MGSILSCSTSARRRTFRRRRPHDRLRRALLCGRDCGCTWLADGGAPQPSASHGRTVMITGFRLLLLLTALIAVLMALVVMPVREVRRKGVSRYRPDRNPQPSASSVSACPPVHKRLGLSRDSWRLVSRFMIDNLPNRIPARRSWTVVVSY